MTANKDEQDFVDIALECGALKAMVVSPTTVETASWVRNKCQYGCPLYGKCLVCPPFAPSPSETRKTLDEFKKAILFQTTPNCYEDVKKIAVAIEQKLFLANYYKAFGYGAGPCLLCAECALDSGCRNSYNARPSMEAAGIDVYATVRKHGFDLNVVVNFGDEQNYFGLVLID